MEKTNIVEITTNSMSNNINNINIDNASTLKFFCEIKNTNFKIDVTDIVYKKCIYYDNYIYIPKKNINRFLLFEDFGLYYYDGIVYNFIIIDNNKIYNVDDTSNILIDIYKNILYYNQDFMKIDEDLTVLITNNQFIKKYDFTICFIIAVKYVRGYNSYIKKYVDNIQQFYKESFIIIVDNNSEFIDDIKIIFKDYTNIIIITNTSNSKMDIGAYTYGLKWLTENDKLNYNYYVFTQDTLFIENKYDFNKLYYNNIKACSILSHEEHFCWYRPEDKIKILSELNIEQDNTHICACNSFIIHENKVFDLSNYLSKFMLQTKEDLQLFERIMSFIIKQLESKLACIDGFWSEGKTRYFKKILQNKNECAHDLASKTPILQDNIITFK